MLTTIGAARILGVTSGRVRQLDDALQPTITEDGRRIYKRSIVEALAERRSRKARGNTVAGRRTGPGSAGAK